MQVWLDLAQRIVFVRDLAPACSSQNKGGSFTARSQRVVAISDVFLFASTLTSYGRQAMSRDPGVIWRHQRKGEAFWQLVCPLTVTLWWEEADKILKVITARANIW